VFDRGKFKKPSRIENTGGTFDDPKEYIRKHSKSA
jgi:hypothetical protein